MSPLLERTITMYVNTLYRLQALKAQVSRLGYANVKLYMSGWMGNYRERVWEERFFDILSAKNIHDIQVENGWYKIYGPELQTQKYMLLMEVEVMHRGCHCEGDCDGNTYHHFDPKVTKNPWLKNH